MILVKKSAYPYLCRRSNLLFGFIHDKCLLTLDVWLAGGRGRKAKKRRKREGAIQSGPCHIIRSFNDDS
jgi:hypothetical protein